MTQSILRSLFSLLLVLLLPGLVLAHGDKGDIAGPSSGGQQGGPFPAWNVEMVSHLPLADIGGDGGGIRGNDIWGWTDPLDNKEYALVGRTDGLSFVDVSDPVNPVYLGILPTHTGTTAWRDMKVYQNTAYVVSDGNGAHGLQVFDLTGLRGLAGPPTTFTETSHYSGFTRAHNLTVNEDTGYLYVVGANTYSGGMIFLDLADPLNPVAAGGYSGDGYTHDSQVVTYHGPDTDYSGQEIAFNANEDTVTIVDITNKLAPSLISKEGYVDVNYVHQGWLTEDHRYFLSNDELDEYYGAVPTTLTHIWDLEDLDNPLFLGSYDHGTESIDHNLYIKGKIAFEGNYTTGMRVLDLGDIGNGNIDTIAWMDTHPSKDDSDSFDGVWSVYPYFESGTILIGDRNEGLVVAQLDMPEGDSDFDGDVDLDDLINAIGNFTGPNPPDPADRYTKTWADGDVTPLPWAGDGDVDLDDIISMVGAFTGPLDNAVPAGWTFIPASSDLTVGEAAVPEPSSVVLALMGFLGVISITVRRAIQNRTTSRTFEECSS